MTNENYYIQPLHISMNSKQQAAYGIDRDRAMFLANLYLIMYRVKLRYAKLLQCDANAASNPESKLLQDIFSTEFYCNDSKEFDPAALHRSRTQDSRLLEVKAWFWHTEKPVDPLKLLRTLHLAS